jgi:hypothetical protein
MSATLQTPCELPSVTCRQRLRAQAARRLAWRGNARPGQAAQDGVRERVRGFRAPGPRDHRSEDAEGGGFQTGLQGEKGRMTPLRRASRLWAHAGVGVVEREYLLAEAGRDDRRWDGGQLEMTQDTGYDRFLGDGGNHPQGATSAKRAGRHSQIKHTAQQPGPVPVRRSRLRCIAVDTLLARCGNDRGPQRAMRR